MKTETPNDPIKKMFDFEALEPETIKLEPTHIKQALQVSRQMLHQGREWQTYINALAFWGFQQWLEHRAPEIPIDLEGSFVLHPALANLAERVGANLIDAVANIAGFLEDKILPMVSVGDFKVCLIAIDSLWDEEITIPKASIDLPEFTPHFYTLIEVQEELGQATVQSFLRYDQLIKLQSQNTNLEISPDWTYTLPITWFAGHPDQLLLYLDCLEPTAISIPTATSSISDAISKTLTAALPQVQSSIQSLWRILTWEQVAAVLTSPESLLREQQKIPANSVLPIIQPVMNVALWLHNQMDELTKELAWVLLPPISPAMRSAMRSPAQELEAVVRELEVRRGTKTPNEARGAYHDFQLAESQLRLYAIIWSLSPAGDIPEWTLLLVLGAQPSYKLPHGIKLQVSDREQILVERTFDKNTGDSYLYVRVAGQWDETFLVTIALPNGVMLTLPPFAFYHA